MVLTANVFANPPMAIVEMVARFTVLVPAMVMEFVTEKLNLASVTVRTQVLLVRLVNAPFVIIVAYANKKIGPAIVLLGGGAAIATYEHALTIATMQVIVEMMENAHAFLGIQVQVVELKKRRKYLWNILLRWKSCLD